MISQAKDDAKPSTEATEATEFSEIIEASEITEATVATETTNAAEATVKEVDKLVTEPPKPEWKEVRRKPKKRMKIIRPDALIIKACGDTSYAIFSKQVKRDPNLIY
ncbi:hypothetical protein CVS40_8058 [Lucilia cuprina]|nr:hypothetical protein CVS40_8058 [Lucilia cuprina]